MPRYDPNIEVDCFRRSSGVTLCRRHNQDRAPSKPCAKARWLMQRSFRVWDTETTGLEDDSKIVSIGIVDQSGTVLVDTLINPGEHIPRDATAIHGVTDDMVATAPLFPDLYPQIRAVLEDHIWAIYNADYDMPRLNYECDRYLLPRIHPAQNRFTPQRDRYCIFENVSSNITICMMNAFAVHYGDWSDYFGSYKWKSLGIAADYYRIDAGNAHNALADAITTLELIRNMAFDEDQRRTYYEVE